MHELLDFPDSNIAGIKLSGTLTEEDYHAIVPHLEEMLEAHTTTRVLFALDDVEDWEPDELWSDWAFDMRHVRDLDKVAVVGDDLWDEWIEKVNLLFPVSQIRTFEADGQEEAEEWLRGEMEVPGIGPGSVPDPMAGAQDESDA